MISFHSRSSLILLSYPQSLVPVLNLAIKLLSTSIVLLDLPECSALRLGEDKIVHDNADRVHEREVQKYTGQRDGIDHVEKDLAHDRLHDGADGDADGRANVPYGHWEDLAVQHVNDRLGARGVAEDRDDHGNGREPRDQIALPLLGADKTDAGHHEVAGPGDEQRSEHKPALTGQVNAEEDDDGTNDAHGPQDGRRDGLVDRRVHLLEYHHRVRLDDGQTAEEVDGVDEGDRGERSVE